MLQRARCCCDCKFAVCMQCVAHELYADLGQHHVGTSLLLLVSSNNATHGLVHEALFKTSWALLPSSSLLRSLSERERERASR